MFGAIIRNSFYCVCVGGGIVYYPIKITHLFQKQGVITQLTKTLFVALIHNRR